MSDVTVTDVLRELRKIQKDIPETVKNAILSSERRIIRMQQQQLYDGKNNLGQDIRPYYTEDSYFKTMAQAQGYIKWKLKLTPNSKRNPNAPNLYINGYFHRSLIIVLKDRDLYIESRLNADFSSEIIEKYADLLGLTPENQEIVDNEIIAPEIWELFQR